uniref:Uncharacterized protein n=1 Tax=Crocodylus porosus TaxID=8502 RepID=A0A7M4EIP8_CROPO
MEDTSDGHKTVLPNRLSLLLAAGARRVQGGRGCWTRWQMAVALKRFGFPEGSAQKRWLVSPASSRGWRQGCLANSEARRVKSVKFMENLMIHSGDPGNYYVDTAVRHILLRGIKVKIMLPWDLTEFTVAANLYVGCGWVPGTCCCRSGAPPPPFLHTC